MTTETEVEEFLEHFGVKGMKWGVRNELNKAAKEEERLTGKTFTKNTKIFRNQVDSGSKFKSDPLNKIRTQRDKTILKARDRVESKTTKMEYKKAKAQYKINKRTLGKVRAKQILSTAKAKKMVDVYNARATRDGKETTFTFMSDVGSMLLVSKI